MKFCWVTLPVKDFKKSLDFYHGTLGLPIDSEYKGDGIEMAMLGEENKAKIEIISLDENKSKNLYSDITVGLEVKSLESTIDFLNENNIPILRGPIEPNPNVKFIYINDPNGFEVQLVEIKE